MAKVNINCPMCGKNDVFSASPEEGCSERCESCGAKKVDGVWSRRCAECGKEVAQLHGLFVPHLCKECLDIKVAKQLKDGDVCGICGRAYALCCC